MNNFYIFRKNNMFFVLLVIMINSCSMDSEEEKRATSPQSISINANDTVAINTKDTIAKDTFFLGFYYNMNNEQYNSQLTKEVKNGNLVLVGSDNYYFEIMNTTGENESYIFNGKSKNEKLTYIELKSYEFEVKNFNEIASLKMLYEIYKTPKSVTTSQREEIEKCHCHNPDYENEDWKHGCENLLSIGYKEKTVFWFESPQKNKYIEFEIDKRIINYEEIIPAYYQYGILTTDPPPKGPRQYKLKRNYYAQCTIKYYPFGYLKDKRDEWVNDNISLRIKDSLHKIENSKKTKEAIKKTKEKM